jgi:hypothetical protein
MLRQRKKKKTKPIRTAFTQAYKQEVRLTLKRRTKTK